MSTYTFPFSTCETPTTSLGLVAQPFSAAVNLVSVAIILFFLAASRSYTTRTFFLILLLFESWHTYSHITHVPGHVQVDVIHVLSYLLNLSLLYMFVQFTGAFPASASSHSCLYSYSWTCTPLRDCPWFTISRPNWSLRPQSSWHTFRSHLENCVRTCCRF